MEIQNAIKVFKRIPDVIELRGTKRFVPGDPLVKFLECMRAGKKFSKPVWDAFAATFAEACSDKYEKYTPMWRCGGPFAADDFSKAGCDGYAIECYRALHNPELRRLTWEGMNARLRGEHEVVPLNATAAPSANATAANSTQDGPYILMP